MRKITLSGVTLGVLGIAGLLSGTAQAQGADGPSAADVAIRSSTEAASRSPLDAILGGVNASGSGAEEIRYELRTGDRLRFRIEEDPAAGKEPLVVAVNSVGEASFPVSRESDIRVTLTVRGKTLNQVKEMVAQRLLEEFYNRATVELNLDEKVLAPGKIQFFGEMRGTIPLLPDHPPIYLSQQMLDMGIPDFANTRRVKIHRFDAATQASKVIEVDVQSIIKGGQRAKDVVLQDGDRVEVRQKWIN